MDAPNSATHGATATAVALAVAFGYALLDAMSKSWALQGIDPFVGDDLGPLHLDLTYNAATSFGLFSGPWLTGLLVALYTAVSVAVLVAVARHPHPARIVAAGLLIGGAAGNLFDRLVRTGLPPGSEHSVVDWIRLPGGLIVNLADIGIVIGSAALVVQWLSGLPDFIATRQSAG